MMSTNPQNSNHQQGQCPNCGKVLSGACCNNQHSNAWMIYQSQKSKLIIVVPALLLTSLITLWAGPPPWLAVWIAKLPPKDTSPERVKEPEDTSAKKEKETKKKDVNGIWVSGSSANRFLFTSPKLGVLQVYREVEEEGQLLVATGTINEQDIELRFLGTVAKRWASVKLKLSEDNQRLDGKYLGLDPAEKGDLIFFRVGP